MKLYTSVHLRNDMGSISSKLSSIRTGKRFWAALFFPPVLLSSLMYGLHWAERALTFDPTPYIPGDAWVMPRGGEEVSFLNRRGLRLNGWFVSSESQPAPATIIYFHGKSGNISGSAWLAEKLALRGFNVLLFDYCGYGKSEGQIADERDLYADADAAYEYVVDERGIAPERVVLYGHSLGTAAAADLASRRRCGALILESGLSSASEMASAMLPWLPAMLHALGQNRLESAKKLARVQCPVFITHGEPDAIVPTKHAYALFAASREPKRLMILPGAEHNVSGFGGDRYFNELAGFVRDSLLSDEGSSLKPHAE
ncbi:MAG TPA: alpha/beta fold hydrolase [Blastocatellia bacterium]|nr:alpha/beta fold hydrolase [Blastocatellia bacterium]